MHAVAATLMTADPGADPIDTIPMVLRGRHNAAKTTAWLQRYAG